MNRNNEHDNELSISNIKRIFGELFSPFRTELSAIHDRIDDRKTLRATKNQ